MPSTSAVQRSDRLAVPPDRRPRYSRPSEPRYTLMCAQVRSITALTLRINRICFDAPAMREFPFATQDPWVKLFFPPAGTDEPEVPEGEDWYRAYLAMPDTRRPPMRTYTVRDRDDDARTVTIDFVLHGDLGPASVWASRAVPGDRIAIYGPALPDPQRHPAGVEHAAGGHATCPCPRVGRTSGWPARRQRCAPCAGSWSGSGAWTGAA